MALTEKTIGRLDNWKFEQAVDAMTAQPDDVVPTDDERALVVALAETFGNSGWFSGNLAVVVGAAVGTLVPGPDPTGEPRP